MRAIDNRQAIYCLQGRWRENSPVGTVGISLLEQMSSIILIDSVVPLGLDFIFILQQAINCLPSIVIP